MSCKSWRASLAYRTRATPSAFDAARCPRASCFKSARSSSARIAAIHALLPCFAQPAELLGFSPLEGFHQAQGFADDFARGRITAGPYLGFDEIRQLLGERYVHVHRGLPA